MVATKLNGVKHRERLLELSSVLASYSLGKFSAKATVSDALDDLDSIISGVNMLGEELSQTAVSRNFLSAVLNNITEQIIVLDEGNSIVDHNIAASRFFKSTDLKGVCIELLMRQFYPSFKLASLSAAGNNQSTVLEIKDIEPHTLFLSCYMTPVYDRTDSIMYRLLVIKDITEQRQTETRILRAVIGAQEHERERIAKDLHDAFGSELGVLRPVLSSILVDIPSGLGRITKGVKFCHDAIAKLLQSVREICFDIAPRQLRTEGLGATLKAFKKIVEMSDNIQFTLDIAELNLNQEQSLNLFRITQEFVNNSLKHAHASHLKLKIYRSEDDTIFYSIEDNGQGFDIDPIKAHDGRGLENMRTRVKIIGGSFNMTSTQLTGTKLLIQL